MRDGQLGKRLARLVKEPHLWSVESLVDDTVRKDFNATLPAPSSSQWSQQWKQANASKREDLAKLWLLQLFAHAGRGASPLFINNVTRQWRRCVSLAQEMYPYWDKDFLDSLPVELVSRELVNIWLRPTQAPPRWHQFHDAWFGTTEEKLVAVAALGTLTMDEIRGDYGPVMFPVALQLCRDIQQMPGADIEHKLAYVKHLYASGYAYSEALPKTTALEDAWINAARYANKGLAMVHEEEIARYRYSLLRCEPLCLRMALLEFSVYATKHTDEGIIGSDSEAYRWAQYAETEHQVVTIYDSACAVVPEHTQHWRNAAAIGIPIEQAVSSVSSPAGQLLVEVPDDFSNLSSLGNTV